MLLITKYLNTTQLATTAFANGVTPRLVAVQTGSSNDSMTRIIYPTDAYYNSIYSEGAKTGAICITLPTAIKLSNTMLKMTVNIYSNSSPINTSSICIAGYWGSSTWVNTSATITSGSTAANFPVSFGMNGSGVPCIYIGKVTSTWSLATRVSVDNLLASYSGATIANLSSGWNIGIVTSITGLSTYSQEHIDDMIAAGHSELPTLGAPTVLNSNFTQAKGLYDMDADDNVLTLVNSTSARFTGPISTYPLSTYKVNSKLYNQLFITSRLGDLSYQQLMLSPTTNSAGGIGFAGMYKYDADGLNPSYKPLFGMNPDTGVVSFNYIPTAPTAALGDNTTQLATTAFVQANANPTSSYATQAEVNAGTVTNKAVAPSTFAASTQLASKASLAANNTFTGVNTFNNRVHLSYGNGSPSGIVVFSNPGSQGSTCYIGSDNAGAGGYNGIVFGANQSRPWLNNLGTTNNSSSAIATLSDVTANGGGIVASGSNANGSWVKYANGLIQQWGTNSAGTQSGYTSMYFPVAFSNTSYGFSATVLGVGAAGYVTQSNIRGVTSIGLGIFRTCDNVAISAWISWQAEGY